ncbi:helicase RepA family protein [Kaistia sp. UC242_56]|uniref:helicase RepA family protein n=1 Tax=Kaistia sp. UC242_56 TaxID=3374625 RepID=UPI0037B2F27E
MTQSDRSYEQDEITAFVAPVAAASYEDREAAVAHALTMIDMGAVEACQAGEDLPAQTAEKFNRAYASDGKFRTLWDEGKDRGDITGSGYLASLAAAVATHDFDATDFATTAAKWSWTNEEKTLSARSLARAWGRVGDPRTPSHVANKWYEAGAQAEPLFPADASDQATSLRRFELIPIGAAARDALTISAKPLVKGLLDQGAMSVLFGESNVGKSFVAMDLAQHIASGAPWAGMKTAGLPVVYIAAEGGGGVRKRAAALVSKYGDAGERFRLLVSSVDLLHPDADLQPLLATLHDLPEQPGLIVIDTLARAMAGGDENSSTDMGALVKNLDKVRAVTSAHLLIVHHTGKDRSKGARGHSSLRAAVDTEIEVADGVISVTKQRDLDETWLSPFALDVVCLGVDEDGAPITSCTVRLLSEAPLRVETATDAERQVLDVLEDLQEARGKLWRGATLSELVGHFVRNGGAITEDAVRSRLKQLEKKRLVVKPARGCWSPRAVAAGSTTPQNDNLSLPSTFEAVGRVVEGIFS